MEFKVEQENPRQIYLEGYKRYFYRNYRNEIIVNCIIMLISLGLIISDNIIILGYIIFGFALIYLLFLWYFFYMGPISAITKRKSSKSILFINDKELYLKGENAEFKYKWKAIKKVCFIERYIYIVTQDNQFIIIESADLHEDGLQEIQEFLHSNDVKTDNLIK